jgi:uncharacterized membrane protein YkvA (DUF1232 family)
MNKGRRFGTYVGLLRFISLIPPLPKVIRLGWRLFRDRRVPFYLKGMVVAALLYVLSPFDFISEIVFPGLGYLDDATLLLLASYLFMRWSPQEVVAEHVAALGEIPTLARSFPFCPIGPSPRSASLAVVPGAPARLGKPFMTASAKAM